MAAGNTIMARLAEYEELEERLGIMTEPRLDGLPSDVDRRIIQRFEERGAYLRRILRDAGVKL